MRRVGVCRDGRGGVSWRLTLGVDILRIEGVLAARYAAQVRTSRNAGVRQGGDVITPAARGAHGSVGRLAAGTMLRSHVRSRAARTTVCDSFPRGGPSC